MKNLGNTGEEILSLERERLDDGQVGGMGSGSFVAPTATGDLSGDNHRADHTLGMVVRERDILMQERSDEISTLISDARLDSFCVGVLVPPSNNGVNTQSICVVVKSSDF